MFTRHQALIAGLVVVLGLSAAGCATAPPPSSAMKLGALTTAPEAFIDFCRRQPVECGVAPLDSKEQAAEVAARVERQQAEAARLSWQAAFARSAPTPMLTRALATRPVGGGADWARVFAAIDKPAASQVEKSSVAEPILGLRVAANDWDGPTAAMSAPSGFDWAKVFGRTRTGVSALNEADPTLIDAPAIDLASAQTLDAALWGKLNRINTKINRAIIRRTDEQAYGVADLWSLPLENGQKYGDCEDYVLEKRLALVAAGVPQSALSIAVVETSWGEGHAVLVVTTDKGEYVLDNLTPWVVPWTETTYRWKARQTARSMFSWAMVASL